MALLGVIATFDEIERGLPRLGMRGQGHPLEQFALQRRKETLGHRVIERIAVEPFRLPSPRQSSTLPSPLPLLQTTRRSASGYVIFDAILLSKNVLSDG